MRCGQFVGFKGEEYHSAVKASGHGISSMRMGPFLKPTALAKPPEERQADSKDHNQDPKTVANPWSLDTLR
jgi:hypothetical protein